MNKQIDKQNKQIKYQKNNINNCSFLLINNHNYCLIYKINRINKLYKKNNKEMKT